MRVVREILGCEAAAHAGTEPRARARDARRSVAQRRSVAFVVSDFFAHGYERALALAAAKHDVIPVMLVDPRDEELPDVGLATFEDLETGERSWSTRATRGCARTTRGDARRAAGARGALQQARARLARWCAPTVLRDAAARPVRPPRAEDPHPPGARWGVVPAVRCRALRSLAGARRAAAAPGAARDAGPARCRRARAGAGRLRPTDVDAGAAADAGPPTASSTCPVAAPRVKERLPRRGAERLRGRAPGGHTTARGDGAAQGFKLQGSSDAAKALEQAGLRHPRSGGRRRDDAQGGAGEAGKSVTTLTIPMVPLPPKPGRNAMLLPPLPIAWRAPTTSTSRSAPRPTRSWSRIRSPTSSTPR